MEKKKRWLILSIVVCALTLVPLAIASKSTKSLDSDIVTGTITSIARLTTAILLIVYIKKVYKIKIGIKRESLFKGMFWHGLAIILFTVGAVALGYVAPEKSVLEALPVLLFYLVVNLLIGLFEEVLCRGLLFNAFKAYFGDNKKGVYLSAFLSAFLFGALHLGNLNGSNTVSTITQIIYATFFGMLFAVIYYRTGNLLSCILLHGIVDYADAFWNCFLNDRLAAQLVEETTDSSIGEAFVTLALTSIFMIAALVQLKIVFKNKTPKVRLERASA